MLPVAHLVNLNPEVRAPIPDYPAAVPASVQSVQEIGTDADVSMRVRARLNAPSATSEFVRSVPHGVACADDVHRPVDTVRDGHAAPESTCVLDLDRDIQEAIAIKVAELVDRIQSGRELEALIEPRRVQRAVHPERDAPKCGRRELGRSPRRLKYKGGNEERAGPHVSRTRPYRATLLRAPVRRRALSAPAPRKAGVHERVDLRAMFETRTRTVADVHEYRNVVRPTVAFR